MASTSKVKRPVPAARKRLGLRIEIREIEPPIWREISVPDSFTLLQLHRCIQLRFGWLDYHQFEFQYGARRAVGASDEGEELAEAVRLSDWRLRRGASLLYVYDLGDWWEHEIVVRNVWSIAPGEQSSKLARLTDGSRAAPPEDAGGAHGYARMLAAHAGPRNRDEEDLIEWLGAGFDPELFDLRAGDHALVLATAWSVI